ncbi:hypothetical protein JD844_001448 [Phrynosoma platyrhinos]|uniref:Germ cell-specific gene 1-like protein n=1 Tax=Phrynosoma platyrhinos TaxID=52577 RepID=A0ABQ7T9Q7_PHRPL|nr:hypothetical protein JD844_001448 [Phrynosoma platyrhinos]
MLSPWEWCLLVHLLARWKLGFLEIASPPHPFFTENKQNRLPVQCRTRCGSPECFGVDLHPSNRVTLTELYASRNTTMIKLSRRSRSMLSLALNSLALCFSVSAFCTSYWCEGTHKVVKPPCLSAVKKGNCVPVNSNDTMDGNVTMDPHVVQYIWETGEDKYAFRYFHTGFWLSCEEHQGGIKLVHISKQ